MKRAFLYLFILAGLIIPCHLHASDIALIGNIPSESLIDSIALSPGTGKAFGIDKEKKCLYIIDVNSHLITKKVSLARRPVGIAVNPSNNLAYVTLKSSGSGHKKSSLCIVDSTGAVLNSFSIKGNPHGIAVNPVNSTIVTALEKDKKLLILSADSMQALQEIKLPFRPRLVALDTDSNRAVVTAGEGAFSWWQHIIMIVDLNTGVLTNTIKLKRGVKGIAVDTGKDIAVTTGLKEINLLDIDTGSILSNIKDGDNLFFRLKLKGVSDDNKEYEKDTDDEDDTDTDIKRFLDRFHPEIDHLIIKDLKNASGVLSAFQTDHTYGLDINQSTHIAVISGEDSLLLLDMNTNTLNEFPLDDIRHLRAVAVDKYRNIGLVSYLRHKHHKHSDTGVLEVQLPNPVPEITNLIPSFATSGDPDTSLQINGDKFMTQSKVQFGLYGLDTVFADNNTLNTIVPSALLSKAGIFGVTVTNPLPSGGTSNSFDFTVNNPAPSISTIDPSQAIAGTPGLDINVFGTGFTDDTTVFINGTIRAYTPVSATKLQIRLSTEDLKNPGQIEIKAFNLPPGGGYSNSAVFRIKESIIIAINAPIEGSMINSSEVMVKGQITNPTGNETGVTVNGIIAALTNNEFTVNHVPLTEGANTITVTAVDTAGTAATKSITVNAIPAANYISTSANPESAAAPMDVYLRINGSFTVSSPVITIVGPGTVEQLTSDDPDEYRYRINTGGIYYFTAQAVGPDSNTYQDTIAITVLPLAQIDTLLRVKWSAFADVMQQKDTEAALKMMLPSSRGKYQIMFDLLKDQLPDIVSTYVNLELESISENRAWYELTAMDNGALSAYRVGFIKDANGLWYIREF